MTTIAVTGASGAMGREVRELASERADVDLGLAITRQGSIDADVPVVEPGDLGGALTDVEVLVDFTVPEASLPTIRAAANAGVAAVIGTTGFTDEEEAELRELADTIPVLLAANFSRGVYALHSALDAVVPQLEGYDIELTETHHNRKRDAPSGTAHSLLDRIQAHRADAEAVHGRAGEAPREPHEIGVHARRAGSITGEHEILLAGGDEEIRLVHRAESRRVFAAGALDAAAWIADESPGWYRFADVVEA